MSVTISAPVENLEEALGAVADGAGDLVIPHSWSDEEIGRLRDALTGHLLVERTALPLHTGIDAMRDMLSATEFRTWCNQTDGSGAARPRYEWAPGRDMSAPVPAARFSAEWADDAWTGRAGAADTGRSRPEIAAVLSRALDGRPPSEAEVALLFTARGAEVDAIAAVADELRERQCGETVSYVINRNINYTNQCYFRCGFCGFSRGPKSLEFRDDPYLLSIDNIVERSKEAWAYGATEVCLVGGIHPSFDGNFYLDIVKSVKAELPDMHIHGFTPLEIWQGAATLDIDVPVFLELLKDAGLGTLPGTAAEILDDRVREYLCPDKLRTAEWADVMISAHELGLRATSTIMHGHIDSPEAIARHYEVLREIQRRTGGLHRVRAAAVRPHGRTDVSAGQVAAGPDLGRGRPDPRGGPHRVRRSHPEHSGQLGQAGARGWRPPAGGRLQRSRRHFDEREHLPGLRGCARSAGDARGARAGDPAHGSRPGPAHDALRTRRHRSDRLSGRARPGAPIPARSRAGM